MGAARITIGRLLSRAGAGGSPVRKDLSWGVLTLATQVYIAAVVLGGAAALLTLFPRAFPQPGLFALLVAAACLTAAWKVNLMIPLGSGSTLSVSCAAKFTALLLLGPQQALIVACAAAVTQCTYRTQQRYPVYRTVFSVMAEASAMAATGVVYVSLGGTTGPFDVGVARPLVCAIATYFVVNTGLVAGAIALSTNRSVLDVWRHDFLWSGVTFMVAGTLGALAAVVIDRGEHWLALLLLAPVYLTYRSYQLFLGRFLDQQRHITDMRAMHEQTVVALAQAHEAERALAAEKERLASALADKVRLEERQTELLEREQAARASAEEANRLKDRFLAVVSHELRTPLNAILGWADMLRAGRLEGASHHRACQAIFHSAQRQAQLIDELLDVARIMSGKLRLERTFVNLEEVVNAAVQLVQPSANARRLRIRTDLDRAVGLVYADRARLQQVAGNLLANAIKFTPEGGSILVRLRRRHDVVELAVSDTGQGIAPELLQAIFEPFRQADDATTRQHEGLGLGLSIVKHLVEEHGGTVAAASSGPGCGATVTVALPLVIRSATLPEAIDRAADPRDVPDARPARLAGLSVLVVDDDEENREVVKAHLEGHQAVVLCAGSAAEAFALLAREPVDVLLADIGMPGEDGYTLMRKVRALGAPHVAAIPAAALTAFARNEDRQLALDAGFQLHLVKPIDARTLVGAVANLAGLESAPAARSSSQARVPAT